MRAAPGCGPSTPARHLQPAITMLSVATGTFDVSTTPITEPTAMPGRFKLEKQFHGDLVGTGQGEMLTAMTDTKGSAGYVAIEQVQGTLRGKRGAFVFQHTGTMSRGAQQLSITVVPDSGTGELVGIAGSCAIQVEGKEHRYSFEYALPE